MGVQVDFVVDPVANFLVVAELTSFAVPGSQSFVRSVELASAAFDLVVELAFVEIDLAVGLAFVELNLEVEFAPGAYSVVALVVAGFSEALHVSFEESIAATAAALEDSYLISKDVEFYELFYKFTFCND